MNPWPGTSCDRRVGACGDWELSIAASGGPDCAGRLSRYRRSLEANDDYAAAGASEQHGFTHG